MPESQRVNFAPNIPQQVALKDLDALPESHSWGDSWYYELTDGRALYVNAGVAAAINMLELLPGEPFVICKRWNGQRSQKVRWDVWRAGESEKAIAAEDTQLSRDLKASLDQVESRRGMPRTPRQPQNPPPPPPKPQEPIPVPPAAVAPPVRTLQTVPTPPKQTSFPWAENLKKQAQVLVDTYAATLAYSSEKHGNSVKPDDIRALTISAYISLSQRGKAMLPRVFLEEIPASKGLDTIQVFWLDYEPGKGSVTIVCWGCAWTCHFNAMSGQTIRQFFMGADVDYLVTKLGITNLLKQHKAAHAYLRKIIEAVKRPVAVKAEGTSDAA